jgi:hypothetical protein
LAEIQLAILMYLEAGVSGRGVSHVFDVLGQFPRLRVPGYTTVLNWIYRCGVHVLNGPVPRRRDWIFVIDHPLGVGQNKCLVVLGIAIEDLAPTGYSPTHREMRVPGVEVTAHSTGEWVAQVLEAVAQRVGVPVQIVADHGSDLRKGINLFQAHWPETVYTYDISHRIATVLKAELHPDARWQSFLAHCNRSAAAYRQSDLAFLLPPRQRAKARFMNLDGHVDWGQRLLDYHDRGEFGLIRSHFAFDGVGWLRLVEQFGSQYAHRLNALADLPYPSEAALRHALQSCLGEQVEHIDTAFWQRADAGRQRFLEGFAWLLDYRQELAEYAQLMQHSKTIQAHLKTQGLRPGARQRLQAHLLPPSTLTPRVAKVTEKILDHVEVEAAKLPHDATWLASSDIIESVFGKYKHFAARGPLKEIGKQVLAIPALLCDRSTHFLKEAMESVRTLDVDDWVETHLGLSMLAKRRRAFAAPKSDTNNA